VLPRGFFMAETGCTQVQWEAVMGNNPSHFKGPDLSVETVNWKEAVDFCRRLTRQQVEKGELPAGWAWRLPTEAEWEYAARAGTTGPRYGDLAEVGWYEGNSNGRPQPVGGKQPNRWGLYDMLGNVLEWCADWYGEYPAGGSLTDPVGPTSGSYRVLRGGGWFYGAIYGRSAVRYCGTPGYRHYFYGFRAVLSPVQP
jgi:formylglycine-generating enzyme required for sulfatase activity